MAQLLLYLNAALYFALAVWSTIAPHSTATRLGYLNLSDRSRAEYLRTYGGLQVGLAVLFLLIARGNDMALGLRVTIGLYAPIVLYRIVTGLMNLPVFGPTLGAVGLEALLLLVAVWLFYSAPVGQCRHTLDRAVFAAKRFGGGIHCQTSVPLVQEHSHLSANEIKARGKLYAWIIQPGKEGLYKCGH